MVPLDAPNLTPETPHMPKISKDGTCSTYPFRKLYFKATWAKQFYSDLGDEYIEQQTFDILTRLPLFYKATDFYLLVKVAKSTSLHVLLARQGWTLASIDEPSVKILDVN